MSQDLQEIFVLALNYFYKKYKAKGGTQNKLARRLGITQSYVSAVLNGSKTASLELQDQLAGILYGPYEEFLAIGRRLKNGLDPEFILQAGQDEGVESLINRLSHYVMDHQRIEKQLVETKNFYETVVEKMQSGVLVTDENDEIYYINNWLVNKYGVSREALMGTYVPEMGKAFPKGRFDEILQHYMEARETLEPQEFRNAAVISPSGEEAYRSGWCIPVVDRREYRGMIVTVGDMTEQTILKKKLEEETWLMRAAMESTDWVGWVILDKANQIIKYNSTYQQMFDMPEELLRENSPRKNIEWVKNMMCDQDYFMQMSFQVLKQGKKFTHEFDLLDGRRIRRVSLPLFRDGELVGRNILVYDITKDKDSRLKA
ncbi:MAG: PAS domain-containing protein, partial [Proteobacteria bacterium]|nr:PAS domain-containing protein [Pseudomonadota bacterium]